MRKCDVDHTNNGTVSHFRIRGRVALLACSNIKESVAASNEELVMLLRAYVQFDSQYGSGYRKAKPDPLWISTLVFVIGVVITATVQALT